MKLISHILALCVLTVLSGCAYFNTAYRSFSVDDGSGALIDIKQRAIIATRRIDPDNKTTDIAGHHHPKEKSIVCAEPSPDGLSAYAAELAGSMIFPHGESVKLASAFQEGSAFVGLRTQSIQLLRDGFYRLCEAYMNDAITKYEYDLLQRRYQKYMVALLAIEQLTGVVKAPAVTIDTQGYAEAGRALSDYTAELTKINSELIEVDDNIAKHIKEMDAAKQIYEKKSEKVDNETVEAEKSRIAERDEAKAKLDKSEKDKAAEEEHRKVLLGNKEAIESGIKNARDVAVGGSTKSLVSAAGLFESKKDNKAIAEAVENIVINVVDTDDFGHVCLEIARDGKLNESKMNEQCIKHFASFTQDRVTNTSDISAMRKVLSELIRKMKPDSTSTVSMVTKLLTDESAVTVASSAASTSIARTRLRPKHNKGSTGASAKNFENKPKD